MGEATPYAAGWREVIPTGLGGPIPIDGKELRLRGFSGGNGAYPDPQQCAAWEDGARGTNLAVRMSAGVVGIDIDHPEVRPLWEGRLGPPSDTWSSTARGPDSERRVLLYRAPPREYRTQVGRKADGDLLGEVIQRHHRYLAVAPSVHPDGGVYRWYAPDGKPADRPPSATELAWLPPGWLAYLSGGVKRDDDAEHDAQWCLSRVTAACKTAAETPEGSGFNDALNTAAFLSGRAVGAELVTEEVARKGLDAAVRAQFAEPDDKDAATIESGLAAGKALPWRVKAFNAGAIARRAHKDRPEVHIGSPVVAVEWLRETIGTGPLAGFFLRDDQLVHTPAEGEDGYVKLTDRKRDDDGPAQVRPVTPGQVRARVQATYRVVREQVKEDEAGNQIKERTSVLFPREAAPFITDAPDTAPNLRRLRGVTHTPLVRADGSILGRPGYDDATGLLFLPDAGLDVPAVPEHPAPEVVKAAVGLLDEATEGFPWAGEHDQANFYGLLLTPLLRELIPAPRKGFVLDAPMPRSGKTLLAEVARILHGGVFRAETPEDEAEWDKTLSTILNVTTGPVVTFDNAVGTVKSAKLAALLTSMTWDARQLGRTDVMIQRRNDRVWTITSNNARLGGDLVPRFTWVRIDPRAPHPELRTNFRHPNLPAWVRERRGDLLAALLILVRAWVVAGRPAPRVGDVFGLWVSTVRGVLATAGVPGTFDASESARQQVGEEDEEWAAFLTAAWEIHGDRPWTVRELLMPANTFTLSIPRDALPGEIAEKLSVGRSVIMPLGKWLGFRSGRWAGGFCVREAWRDRDGTRHWQIEQVSSGMPAGGAGGAGGDSGYPERDQGGQRSAPTPDPAEVVGNTTRTARTSQSDRGATLEQPSDGPASPPVVAGSDDDATRRELLRKLETGDLS